MLKRTLKSLLFFTVFFILFGLSTKAASASEGYVELRSTGTEPYRCYAHFARMEDQEYRILYTCRFILYPADENVFHYVVWGTPENGKDFRLGTIGMGRGEFKTKNKFTSIYVTTEANKDTRNPSGRVVMRGDVKPIPFMEEVKFYEPTPTQAISEGEDNQTTATPTPTDTKDTAQVSTKDKIFTAFRRAGVAAIVAMIALAGLIFVITRSRG